jgi:hypothetical protein
MARKIDRTLPGAYLLQVSLATLMVVMMTKASQREATPIQIFSIVHSWVFCLAACVLIYISRKWQVSATCALCSIMHVLVSLDMYYLCEPLVLVIKIMCLVALPMSIVMMRRLAAVLVEVGASRNSLVTVTPYQAVLMVMGFTVSVLNAVWSSPILRLAELVVWLLLSANLWYLFWRYNQKLNTSFGSFVVPDGAFGGSSSSARTPVVSLNMRKTKRRLKSNMVTGVFLTGNIQIAYFVLLNNAFWGTSVKIGQCSPRSDDEGGTVAEVRFIIAMVGLVVLHLSWWRTIIVSWLTPRDNRAKKTSSLHRLDGASVVPSSASNYRASGSRSSQDSSSNRSSSDSNGLSSSSMSSSSLGPVLS